MRHTAGMRSRCNHLVLQIVAGSFWSSWTCKAWYQWAFIQNNFPGYNPQCLIVRLHSHHDLSLSSIVDASLISFTWSTKIDLWKKKCSSASNDFIFPYQLLLWHRRHLGMLCLWSVTDFCTTILSQKRILWFPAVSFQGQIISKGAKPSSQISLPSEMGDKAHQKPPHISRIKSGRLQAVFFTFKICDSVCEKMVWKSPAVSAVSFYLSTVSGVSALTP